MPDFSLVILLSLLPSVLIIAYYHGRPGPDSWNAVEKISIPVNVLVTIVLLLVLFSGKELGAATKSIIVENEEDQMVERVVAKAVFRKKIILFNFKNNTGKEELDWLQSGMPFSINLDLMQDPFIGQLNSLSNSGALHNKLKKKGFPEGVDLPISLMQEISNELHYEHFLTGEISANAEDEYLVKIYLFDSETGKMTKKK